MATTHPVYRESQEHLLHVAATLNVLEDQTEAALDANAKLIACATGGTPTGYQHIKSAIRARAAQMSGADRAPTGA